MANKDINIVVKLVDNFTSSAARIQVATQRIGQSMDQSGRHIQQFGTKLAFVGGATTGAFLVAMKNVEGAVPAVQRSFAELDNVMRNFQVSIAQSAAPAFEKLVNVLASLVDAWNAVDPATRDAIIQFTFLGGAALIAVGGLLKIGGAVLSIAGKITALISSALNPWGLALLAVSAALVYLIKNWEAVRGYVLPVINVMNIAVDMLAIGFLKLADAALRALEATLRFARQGKLADEVKKWRDGIKDTITTIEKDMTRALETGKGSMATFVDEGVGKLQTFAEAAKETWDKIVAATQGGTQKSKEVVLNWAGLMKDTIQRVANAMQQSLGNFFYNVFTGQIKSAKQAFVEFGNSILRILSDVLAKVVLQKTLGSLFASFIPNFSFFHSGGTIKKAHSGMALGNDEQMIVAQEGEGVLTRQGMSQLGTNGLASLNRGEGVQGGGGAPNVIVIQAWDTRDIARNERAIVGLVEAAMKKNSSIRGTIKRYG